LLLLRGSLSGTSHFAIYPDKGGSRQGELNVSREQRIIHGSREVLARGGEN